MELTFNEIIATVSDEQITQKYSTLSDSALETVSQTNPNFKSLPNEEKQRLVNEFISAAYQQSLTTEQQQKYIAWFAAVVREHVNYENFSKKADFEKTIELMYNDAPEKKNPKEFFDQLAATKEFIEDNHFFLKHLLSEQIKQPDYHCGKNLCKKEAQIPVGYKTIAGVKDDWKIGSVGNDTLIVSIANLSHPHKYEAWQNLTDMFDKIYKKYPHIILDVRNNAGGEDKPIHHIASRLYGNPVNPIESASVRDTPRSRHLLQHFFGPCSKVPDSERVSSDYCTGEIKTLIDETQNFYPFNEQTGYKGKIDVLIDNRTASAGESAYSLFSCLPNVCFIGENTCGMQHYRQAHFATPWGGFMSLGVMSLDYLHGQMCEMKGNEPDLRVKSGVDALYVALDSTVTDLYRQKGFRPEIQKMQEQYKDKKAPRYEPDERKTQNAGVDGITSEGTATDVRRSCYANSVIDGERKIQAQNIYSTFIKKVQEEAVALQQVFAEKREIFAQNQEVPDYNAGTMKEQTFANIAIANAFQFQQAFKDKKQENPNLTDEQTKAQVVHEFLKAHGSHLPLEGEAFKGVSREVFYSTQNDGLFDQALTNTNVFFQNLDVKTITLEPKHLGEMPRNTEGVSAEQLEAFKQIPEAERLEIMYERGLYHELMHAMANTNDERKCDTFALLKTMQKHPEYAPVIFDVYNAQRAVMGDTIKNMRNAAQKGTWNQLVAIGKMTYLMPETYEKLHWLSQHPDQIPKDDSKLLQMTAEMTQKPDFEPEQLAEFKALMQKRGNLTVADLEKSIKTPIEIKREGKEPKQVDSIIKACMKQGGFTDIHQYIESDKKLKKLISLQGKNPNGGNGGNGAR